MNHERIIHILEYLSRESDEKHGVTIRDIQDHLIELDESSDTSVLTVRRDIERLTAMGYDIRVSHGAHNTAYYHLSGKGFTFNEIRFIVDSVSINKFLSHRQKEELIKKFKGMCSDSEYNQLISRVEITDISRIQRDLLGNLDKIHRLISEKRMMNFDYGKFDTAKHVNYYDKHREIIPLKVLYKNERFYLHCFNLEKDMYWTYRIDRMRNIRSGEVSRKKLPPLEKYDGFVPDVFKPERFDTVTFKVRRYMLDEMIEQLGDTVSSREDFEDPGYAIVRAKCGINKQFYLWVMRYGDAIEITAPNDVRQGFAQELKNVSEMYSDIQIPNN
ncbi:MAG: WYL domain-containing protein [Ruminococcus sp.]|nr:WYL domain-containing protein [Ruminococcus sp.]